MMTQAINNGEFILGSLVRTTTKGFFQCNGWDKDPYQRNLLISSFYPTDPQGSY